MSAETDLALTADQANALRESTQTGYWYPQDKADRTVAEYLRRRSLFARGPYQESGYLLTAAGQHWLDAHPEGER